MPLLFPTTSELSFIVRNRSGSNTANYIGHKICPVTPVYTKDIEYDVLFSSFGMTQAHQIGTNPKTVQLPKQETKRTGTAYWKETLRLDEEKLLYARQAGTLNQRAGRDLVIQAGLQLDTRLDNRLEWLVWQTLIAGTIDINENNVKYNVDFKLPAKEDISAEENRWTDFDKSDPIEFLTTLIQGYRGIGAKARTVYMNSVTAGLAVKSKTFVDMLKQSNYAGYLSPLNPVPALKLLVPDVDFVIYDEGYLSAAVEELDDDSTFELFIPDGEIVTIGDCPGEKLMDFASTISLHNGGIDKPQPGKFSIVEDESQRKKNPYVDVTVGVYGLPRVFHPKWIRRAKVA